MKHQTLWTAIALSAAGCLAMGDPPAKAIQVITNGTTYDVTLHVATQDTDIARFTRVEMPWRGGHSLAQTFRNAMES
jgi:hypothetical protein